MSGFADNPHAPPQSEDDLDVLVAGFTAHTWPKAAWTHAAHLAVGAHYIHLLGEEAALPVMRKGVRSYNASVGGINSATSGYHETLTRLWLAVLARLQQTEPGLDRLAFAQRAVEIYGARRDLHRKLYGFDVVNSREARAAWMAPDTWPDAGLVL